MEYNKKNLGVQGPISQKFRTSGLGVTLARASKILFLTPNFNLRCNLITTVCSKCYLKKKQIQVSGYRVVANVEMV